MDFELYFTSYHHSITCFLFIDFTSYIWENLQLHLKDNKLITLHNQKMILM